MNKRLFLLPACLMLLASCAPSTPDTPAKKNDGKTEATALTGAEAVEAIKTLGIEEGGKTESDFYVKDIVTEVTEISTQYGNATLKLAGDFTVYRAKKCTDALAIEAITTADTNILQIQVGDTVTVWGKLCLSHSTYETAQNEAGILRVVFGPDHQEPTTTPEPAMVTGKTLAQIVADTAADKTVKYEVTAKVTKWNTKKDGSSETDATGYGNWFMSDDNGVTEILVYGASEDATKLVWNENTAKYDWSSGKTNFDPSKLAIGDTVKMEVIRLTYNEVKQVQGIVKQITKGEGGDPVDPQPTTPEPAMVTDMTLAQIVADERADKAVKYQLTVTITNWNLNKDGSRAADAGKYGNFFVTDDSTEGEVLVYGVSADASRLAWDETAAAYKYTSRNDFDATTVALNDVVTLQVIRTAYNGVKQIQGILVSVAA